MIESKIKQNIPLSPFTTFQIGGPAKYYLEARTKEELRDGLAWAGEKKEKAYILGGGSNVLIPDSGVSGLVIRLKNDRIEIRGERVEAGAGAALSRIISKCTGNNLSGLEWASGIPRATVGGSVRGNAGAFGRTMADIVETVEIFDREKQTFCLLSNREAAFGYRHSLFKENPELLVWSTVFKMKKAALALIEANIRHSIDFRTQRYPRLPSAGSIFENLPVTYVKEHIPQIFERELKVQAAGRDKISAGLIIDLAGLKGKTIGGIKISLEHANHIVNTGKGRAEEVVMLISYIKQQIQDRFGLQLKEEIQYFGF